MNKMAARLAALSLGIVIACTACATGMALFAPSDSFHRLFLVTKELVIPGAETRLRTEGPRRNERALAEITRLGEHPWAGVYRTAGTWPLVLTIAPDSGFTLFSNSWCANCTRYVAQGSVLASSAPKLTVHAELESQEDSNSDRYRIDGILHLVMWGDLQFAVPESDIEMFCANVCGGSIFPDVPFRYRGTLAEFNYDDPARPEGRPQVPSEYQRLILDKPISCRVLALVEWRRRSDLDYEGRQGYEAVYSVDVGSDDSLAVGMRLFVDGIQKWARYNGRVEHVGRKEGRFQMLARDDERDWANGLVGKMATTLRPKTDAR